MGNQPANTDARISPVTLWARSGTISSRSTSVTSVRNRPSTLRAGGGSPKRASHHVCAGRARLLRLFLRHRGGLPANYLPFTISFQERAGVEIIRDGFCTCLVGCGHEAEGDDGGLAVLLNADFFGGINGGAFLGLRGGTGLGAQVAHDVAFAFAPA